MLDVSIILVSYNTEELTRNCLNSILEKTSGINYDIWIVDNNSSDKSCEMIKREFPQVHLIENKENKGFGAANNQAIKQSEAKYVFLLNTDTILLNNAIKILFDYMEENSDIGACGGNLYDANNKHVHCYGHYKTFKSKMVKTFKLASFFPKEKAINEDKGENENDIFREVDIVVGADLMMRKSVLDEVGIFDEEFFLYDEETELQFRIKQAGHKIMINPNSKIAHLEGKSTKNRAISRAHKMYSEILCYKKCYGTKKLGLYKWICCLPNLPRFFAHPKIIGKTFLTIIKM
ncbi:MAG: glycosyltransferase family 2 protein [Cyanobacteria bacterium SIG29]|nr:glycosyltransferase family 2 protein [Cyanobacteria bacterium SIG29]